MFKRFIALASLITITVINPVFADTLKTVNCKKGATAQEQNLCAQEQLTKLNSKLATVYNKAATAATQLDKSPDGNIKKSLAFSQQSWINYSKTSCDNVAALYQNTADAVTQVTDCKKQIIKARIKQLSQLYLAK